MILGNIEPKTLISAILLLFTFLACTKVFYNLFKRIYELDKEVKELKKLRKKRLNSFGFHKINF